MATCAVCELHAESTFKIEGMDCREEVAMIERRFKNLPGLEDFSADLMGQRLHVKYDAAKVSTSAIAAAVADAGMRAWLEHEEPIAAGGRAARGRRILLGISGAALGLGLLVDALGVAVPLGLILFAPVDCPGRPADGAACMARAPPAVARHQRPDARRRHGRHAARRVVRGGGRGVSLRGRAGARGAHPGDGADRGPRR